MRKTTLSPRWITFAVVCVLLASSGGIYVTKFNENESKVTRMNAKLMTVCIGRLTIDIPEGSKIRYRSARFAGVNIIVQPGYTSAQFKSELDTRESEVASKRNEYDRPSLEKKISAEAINFSTTLLYFERRKPVTMIEFGKPVPGTEEGIAVEAYGIKDGISYLFKAKNLGSPRSEDNVINLVKRFEALASNIIPTQPGFCLENGFVHDPTSADDNETVAMFVSPKGHPDIAIRIDTSINMERIEESLLSRDAKNDLKQEYASRFKSFGRGQRMLNGIPGEEVLDKVKDFNGTSAHAFMWEAPGEIKNVLSPNITLELQTGIGKPGEPVNSSLSDEEVLELWQSITSSLRIRKTSVGSDKKLQGNASDIKLGELAATGQPCPQTGIWECKEKENVEGGPRRFFREGDKMPPAALRAEAGIWDKLRGVSRVEHINTVWKLVDYEAALASISPVSGNRAIADDDNQIAASPARSIISSGTDEGSA